MQLVLAVVRVNDIHEDYHWLINAWVELYTITLRHDCDLDRDTVDPRLSEPHLSEPSIIRITKLTIFIAFVVCIK